MNLSEHRICNARYGQVACYCSALDWMSLDEYGEHVEQVVTEIVAGVSASAGGQWRVVEVEQMQRALDAAYDAGAARGADAGRGGAGPYRPAQYGLSVGGRANGVA